MPVVSSFAREIYRAGIREAQDVLVDCDNVDLIDLTPNKGFGVREQIIERLSYHDPIGILTRTNRGLKPVVLTHEYDLFIMVCPFWRDIFYSNSIVNWRDNCRKSACWIPELWLSDLAKLPHLKKLLIDFDYIFIGTQGTAEQLSESIGQKCWGMAHGVDSLRFCPGHDAPERIIDLYSIGRRFPAVHQECLKFTRGSGALYLFDTAINGDSQTSDYAQHRNLLADLAKRSKLFFVAPGKFDVASYGSQQDIGNRYFEGLAAGATMIGTAPRGEGFKQLFDWPVPVVPIREDGTDFERTVSNLLANPEKLAQTAVRNTTKALQKHDWVYRWRELMKVVGLEPQPAMFERIKTLKKLSEEHECHLVAE